MAIIFKNIQIKKKDFYAWFISEWINSGWQDVSSKASTDYNMLYSKGENNDKELYLNFREASAEGIFSTSTSRMIDVRLPKTYTPSLTSNTAGVVERSSAQWWRVSLISITVVPLDATMSVWYYIDKNYGVFLVEGHNGYNNGSSFFYVGNPHEELKGEGTNTGVVFMSTNCYPATHSMAYVVDDPYSVKTADYALTVYENVPPKTKSTLDKKFCSDIILGDTSGYRFQIDKGILITQALDILTPTDYIINGMKYKFFKTNVYHATTWGNSTLGFATGIRIE